MRRDDTGIGLVVLVILTEFVLWRPKSWTGRVVLRMVDRMVDR